MIVANGARSTDDADVCPQAPTEVEFERDVPHGDSGSRGQRAIDGSQLALADNYWQHRRHQVAPGQRSKEQLVAAAPELEALPIVAQRAVAALQGGEASVGGMAQLLGSDQALAVAVLRRANSGLAMPNRRIGSLREAIARIGLRALWAVLIEAAAGPMLDRGLPPYALSRRTSWRHAATTSRAARVLAARAGGGVDPEAASIAGLLHDVGKSVLTRVAPEMTAEAVSMARSRSVPVWQSERQLFGFDHGQVGGALLRSWGLPDAVVEGVECHHDGYVEAATTLAAIVRLADAAAHLVGAVGGAGACPPSPADPSAARRALGSELADLEHALASLQCVDEGAL
jgi:putative nucleotidyltransferase with HDIG domain